MQDPECNKPSTMCVPHHLARKRTFLRVTDAAMMLEYVISVPALALGSCLRQS